MSELYKGMRVISTDAATAHGVFQRPVMGTVFRTPKPWKDCVSIIRDGHKNENVYHKSFWMPLTVPIAEEPKP